MLRKPCTLIPAPSSPPSEEFNTSFMLLKPHANTAEAQKLVRQELLKRELKLLKEGEITAEEIHQRRIIDVHYGSMAAKALDISPPDLVVQPKGQKAFEDCFGLAWKLALEKDLVCNASEAMERLGFSSQELDRRWTPLQIGTDKVKFGGGFYCGYIEGLYVINGFYCSMRSQYTETGTSVHWYEVQWPVKTMSWASFRSEVLGDTDPARASQSSLRGIMHGCWEELGLQRKPHVGENAVHASASPFEALLERENWLGVEVSKDHFGEMLLEAGISRDVITSWSSDPTVEHDGRSQSLFDLLENMDSERCLETAKKLVSSGWKKTQILDPWHCNRVKKVRASFSPPGLLCFPNSEIQRLTGFTSQPIQPDYQLSVNCSIYVPTPPSQIHRPAPTDNHLVASQNERPSRPETSGQLILLCFAPKNPATRSFLRECLAMDFHSAFDGTAASALKIVEYNECMLTCRHTDLDPDFRKDSDFGTDYRFPLPRSGWGADRARTFVPPVAFCVEYPDPKLLYLQQSLLSGAATEEVVRSPARASGTQASGSRPASPVLAHSLHRTLAVPHLSLDGFSASGGTGDSRRGLSASNSTSSLRLAGASSVDQSQSLTRSMSRLMQDMELAQENPRLRCQQLDRMHDFFERHHSHLQQESPSCRKRAVSPAFLTFSKDDRVMTGSLRVEPDEKRYAPLPWAVVKQQPAWLHRSSSRLSAEQPLALDTAAVPATPSGLEAMPPTPAGDAVRPELS
ncbi:unnamed protein product [Polarella glacialis]|uniref:Uncharacterized protein n=1 Tax=Polarella glacialis TaxID=89957 RepID=A0A813DH37_POLGL|nr:unnamed protein product [Polarella glacialis]